MYQSSPELLRLHQEQASVEQKLQQLQHNQQRLKNRKSYYEKADRKKRTHRLCTIAGTIESHEDAFRKALGAKRNAEVRKELAAKRRMLQKSENRLAELDRLFKRIYEDMVNGKLSEARFQMLADDYEQEQAELREKIDILEDEIQQQEDQTENVDKFIRQAKKYLHLKKLTPAVLNDLVKAVYVHAPDKSSGHRVQDVEISYNYIGILPATLLYDLQNGKTA